MSPNLRLVIVLHNHQPIGNFDGVFECAYQDSYRAFLDVFEQYPGIPIALHTSGSLMEWLAARHPEYLDRLAALVAAGRIEIVGGAFYEPILTMIPPRDRVGQITRYAEWLADRFATPVSGMWIPERVWEQSLTSDLANAGVRYTLLDDFHFKNAGLGEDELHGYYITEDDGKLLSVFPGSERLRYTIPFREPEETIAYLRPIAERQPGAVVVFGDDGEKFGSWPGTKEHVYHNGWLRRFFDALVENRSWLSVVTPTEALDQVPPLGKIYIPEGSYREMTEWALPTERLKQFIHLKHHWEHDGRWQEVAPFVRGGYWRNFKVKYPETNEMYARMQMVSGRLHDLSSSPSNTNGHRRTGGFSDPFPPHPPLSQRPIASRPGPRRTLPRPVQLRLLARRVRRRVLAAPAKRRLSTPDCRRQPARCGPRPWPWAKATSRGWNSRARITTSMPGPKCAWPAIGWSRWSPRRTAAICTNSMCARFATTCSPRSRAAKRPTTMRSAPAKREAGGDVASIHDRVVFKQKDLDQRLQFDRHRRKSLVDHFI